jgi:hypothetical protein
MRRVMNVLVERGLICRREARTRNTCPLFGDCLQGLVAHLKTNEQLSNAGALSEFGNWSERWNQFIVNVETTTPKQNVWRSAPNMR